MKACIFVDNENFRYSLDNVLGFDRAEYLPKNADWTAFYDYLVQTATLDRGERLRTYWYVVRNLDFWPYRLEKPYITANDGSRKPNPSLLRILKKNTAFEQQLQNLRENALVTKMTRIRTSLETLKNTIQKRFDGWTVLQNGICLKHRSIEFRRDGSLTYDLFKKEFRGEKAVDVHLAVDMLRLSSIYDVAIVVSGDQDYVPAVRAVKNCGKHVVNVAFAKRNGQLSPGGARRLNQLTDDSIIVPYDELNHYMQVNTDE